MNCNDVQNLLPEYVGGGLPEPERQQAGQHLAICSHCREEHDSLRHVCDLLAGTPAPEVRVDVPAVYRMAAQRARRRLRWWRRVAIAAAAAALLLFSSIVAGLHIRFERHQLVVQWGEPPETPSVQPVVVHASSEKSTAALEEKLRDLNDLLLGLAADLEARDFRQQEELGRLRSEFSRLRSETIRQLVAAERAEDALLDRLLNEKGTKP